MFCEAYNKPLSDAAASGEALSLSLQQHLASCDFCHAAFAEEQSLFAAIDSGLHASANSEVPATLIPRVHVALNNEPLPQLGFQKWIFAGAIVSCALVVAITLQLRHRDAPVPVRTITAQTATAPSPRRENLHPFVPSAAHENPRRTREAKPAQPSPGDRATSSAAEVLVPDEERAAFAQFMAHTSRAAMNVPARATPVPNAPQESVQILPVEIASLDLKPLEQKEGRQGQF